MPLLMKYNTYHFAFGVHMDVMCERKKKHCHHDGPQLKLHDFAQLKAEPEAVALQEQIFQIHFQMTQNCLKLE